MPEKNHHGKDHGQSDPNRAPDHSFPKFHRVGAAYFIAAATPSNSGEAMIWSTVWVALAVIFAVVIYFGHGRASSLEFVTGYVIELSLSVDNLFVFLLIFRYFQVPPGHQHKVLFWEFS